ncbi:ParA family protein [Hydrogenothermus marinus]|uniref:Chromosome partitioning protein n=1 Tax=Hydrogenothermus marinus TaxID=133270 RepID=A0A3M0BYF8_9AQUI|nr:ParA family protein [Hydrogenothermus marinus]RMB00059.1 chromosome partitioning protein [Hydrogenothermus marinus]
MGSVIGLANIKGGVGKTSLTNALAHEFANLGKKVLVIDVDPQASQTYLFGIDQDDVVDGEFEKHSIFNIYQNKECIPYKYNEKLDVVFSSRILQDGVESRIRPGIELVLNRWITKQKLRDKYDFIFIDPPSNKGILMISTILASDYILIPQRLTLLDETGTIELFLEMSNQAELRGKEMKVLGLVPMFFDKRSKLYREKLIKLRDEIKAFVSDDEFLSIEKEDVFLSPIRQLSVWTKAQEEQMPLRDYILNKDRTYMSVLEEIKKIVVEISELVI